MNTGMLWFDNGKATLEDKLQRAVEYYRAKYGVSPNVCLVHRGCLAQLNVSEVKFGDVAVREFRAVLPHHFWIGIEKAGMR